MTVIARMTRLEQETVAYYLKSLLRYDGNVGMARFFFFFFFEKPNLFAICNNTFSKWWEG
jgi:extradiol dioxygenase family protein